MTLIEVIERIRIFWLLIHKETRLLTTITSQRYSHWPAGCLSFPSPTIFTNNAMKSSDRPKSDVQLEIYTQNWTGQIAGRTREFNAVELKCLKLFFYCSNENKFNIWIHVPLSSEKTTKKWKQTFQENLKGKERRKKQVLTSSYLLQHTGFYMSSQFSRHFESSEWNNWMV